MDHFERCGDIQSAGLGHAVKLATFHHKEGAQALALAQAGIAHGFTQAVAGLVGQPGVEPGFDLLRGGAQCGFETQFIILAVWHSQLGENDINGNDGNGQSVQKILERWSALAGLAETCGSGADRLAAGDSTYDWNLGAWFRH